MRKLLLTVALFAVVGSVNAMVLFDDPSFAGAANSVRAEWYFNAETSPAGILPDDWDTPFAVPTATIVGDASGVEYIDEIDLDGDSVGDRFGIWKTDGYFEFAIDNSDVTGPGTYKDIVVQMIFDSSPAPAVDRFWLRYSADGGAVSTGIEPDETIALDEEYSYARWEFRLPTNPTEEIVFMLPYYCDLYVDAIRIDTVCVPEPATMGMLGLGGVFSLLRRRRR